MITINKYSLNISSSIEDFLHSNLILITTEKEKQVIEEAFNEVLSNINVGLSSIRGIMIKDVFNTLHKFNLFFDFITVTNVAIPITKYLDTINLILSEVTEYIEQSQGLGFHKEYKVPTMATANLLNYKFYNTAEGPWKLTINVFGYIGIDLLTHEEREELLKKYKDTHLYTTMNSYDLLGVEINPSS